MSTQIDFKALRLKLASPDVIKKWSHGEVTRPETINYRTQKPEKDGLFCEKIFGPTKDWECYCGKYKRIRYKGVVCDKCGVEVTRAVVRRERMAHIELSTPVAHIWFLRGVPSKIGLILDLSAQALERVIYFADYIITEVDEKAKEEANKQIKSEVKTKKKEIETLFSQKLEKINAEKAKRLASETAKSVKEKIESQFREKINLLREEQIDQLDRLTDAFDIARKELRDLKQLKIISELEYRDLSMKYGHVFKAGIGAEAVRKLVEHVDLIKLGKELDEQSVSSTTTQRKRVLKRLKLVKGMIRAGVRPEWMILTVLPIIPPDLRPMVPLDGGRYAASDLNDLYRRVINRNNRLKRLKELGAPEVIQRNEKRMLQEAVDALIDNSARRGKAVQASTGQKRTLKSLADMLKGKQGRFRQNLLGKRVDYSGRSVIVVGPKLKLDQCGLPKRMALELFKPFVIADLIKNEYAHNVRSAGKLIEQGRSEVWDALEKVIAGHHVMLNRAPTLHRLGIQAFQPVLIEGKAIQVHPVVCPAFNADFDGDQMAVHVPLSDEAKEEAAEIMVSKHNLLKPATGIPVTTADKDMVLGCFYMTMIRAKEKGEGKIFGSPEEAILAYDSEIIGLKAKIKVRIDGELIETCVGRVLFNEVLPKELQFINDVINKKKATAIIGKAYRMFGNEKTAELIDRIKNVGFENVTRSGFTLSMGDMVVPKEKNELIEKGNKEVEEVRQLYKQGLLTDTERYSKVIEIWTRTKDQIAEYAQKAIGESNSMHQLIESGARGSWGQTTQMVGMKGLVANPSGKAIELPVKGSFKEGLSVLEYFISTHGTRKGLADTALRTASAGYLTRKLVDVSQNLVIYEDDCNCKSGFTITAEENKEIGVDMGERIKGRVAFKDIVDSKDKVLVKAGDIIDEEIAAKIDKSDVKEATIRSVLTCEAKRGICKKCYGWDLGNNELVDKGRAVGIVAAQSIGEPGTQLTMRTFHTGGVAEQDITQGLPRVEELFEARPIKNAAIVAEFAGKIMIEETDKEKKIKIIGDKIVVDEYPLIEGKDKASVSVKDDVEIAKGQVIAVKSNGDKVKAKADGIAKIEKNMIKITRASSDLAEYIIPPKTALTVEEGDMVGKGSRLTEGHMDLKSLMEVSGIEAVQKYILKEVQYIYSSQGQKLSDKHIEMIVRQMLSRAKVLEPGDTEFVPGEILEQEQLLRANRKIKANKGKPATFEQLLLGITKAALSTESFLSAASFQETARVLIDAAILGKVDYLRGLKENVIIGKKLPAGTGFRDDMIDSVDELVKIDLDEKADSERPVRKQ